MNTRPGLLDTSVLIAPVSGRRLSTFEAVSAVEPLPVAAEAAGRSAKLRVRLIEQGHRAKVNDHWIAAVAEANGMDIVTQDDDFDAIEAAGGPSVIRV